MYVKKYIREFIETMPKEKKLPKHWRKFVNKNNIEHNLIIKHGNEYECTNCKKHFFSDIHVGQETFCPFCNNRYLVRNSNLKRYFDTYKLAFLDNMNNKIVVRMVEVCRKYNYKTRSFIDSVSEYARLIPEMDLELINDRYGYSYYYENICHTSHIKKWKVYFRRYSFPLDYDDIYMNNFEEISKGTIYEYAPIRIAIEYLKLYKQAPNVIEILNKAKYKSFELLIKAGLYNLGINTPEKYDKKGNFYQRFGVEKSYYEFMKKHDISHNELLILSIIKRENINLIREILKFLNNSENNILALKDSVDLLKLIEYSKSQVYWNLHSYLDYIENMKKMNIPLTKKILFPEDLAEAHDDSIERVKVVNSKILKEKIKKRYIELKENIYKDDKYFIRPAKTIDDMKDEAKQQGNCVYKVYSEKYGNGNTDIYFLRENDNPKKSLVTVEVNNKKIRQQYPKYNREVTNEQNEFLKQWEKNIIQKVA